MNLHTHPKLKQNPFEVPEGYFETVQSKIVATAYPHKQKTISLKQNLIKYAAAAVILLAVSFWVLMANLNQMNSDQWAEVLIENLDAYEMELLMNYADIGIESDLLSNDDLYLMNSDISANEVYENYTEE